MPEHSVTVFVLFPAQLVFLDSRMSRRSCSRLLYLKHFCFLLLQNPGPIIASLLLFLEFYFMFSILPDCWTWSFFWAFCICLNKSCLGKIIESTSIHISKSMILPIVLGTLHLLFTYFLLVLFLDFYLYSRSWLHFLELCENCILREEKSLYKVIKLVYNCKHSGKNMSSLSPSVLEIEFCPNMGSGRGVPIFGFFDNIWNLLSHLTIFLMLWCIIHHNIRIILTTPSKICSGKLSVGT